MMKTRLAQLRMDMQEKLDELSEEYSIEIKLGRITYTDNSFRASITGDEIAPDGTNRKRLADWHQAVKLGRVKGEWLNKTIAGGYKIVGYDFKKRSRSIILIKDGRMYSGVTASVERTILIG